MLLVSSEPNAYLHIGHARAIITDFESAKAFNGRTNLRFDDTNPTKEDKEFVDAIIENLAWLGYKPDNIFYGSDYFEKTYDKAILLIKRVLLMLMTYHKKKWLNFVEA